MIPCISVENMRLSDAYTIEHLVPSLELMHRAAYGVFLAHNWISEPTQRVKSLLWAKSASLTMQAV